MILRDISFQTPQENLSFDDLLFQSLEHGPGEETLRFWESRDTYVVLGRICKKEDDLNVAAVDLDGVPVLRRSSGGGTVLQGKGCLNYSLVLSKSGSPEICDLRKSYQHILGKVVQALGLIGIEAVFLPISDIALKSGLRKFSGNAQRRGRKAILHHGTILYDFDLSSVERYLTIPKSVPEYRAGRAHKDFMTNISVPSDSIKQALADTFCADRGRNELIDGERVALSELLKCRNEYRGVVAA